MVTIAITMVAEAVENALLEHGVIWPLTDFPTFAFRTSFRSDPVEPGVFILQPDVFRER
jgi:hypothetical protein